MDTNILLESGTNELEVLEFTLGDNHYGINVAKIREILQYMPVTPVPNTHPSVEGIFMPRDTMITVINLKNCLNLPQTDEKGLFIITNFNKLNVAFHVDQVIGIHRVSWENIIKPDETLTGEHGSTATGVIKMDDRLIVILDFEAIVASISPQTGLRVNDIDEMEARDRSDATILIAEDSALLSKLITECLKKSGYTNLHLDSVILKQLCVDDDRIIEMYHTVILYRYRQHRTYDFHILHLPVVESYLIHQIKSCFFHPLDIV
jgi:two-component system chemotaxis response regulator CheV